MNQAEHDLLVLAVQGGNQKALGELFNLHYKPLIGFALKLSQDKELASDAVQEAWIKAAKNIRDLKDPRAFKSWIYRLVRWKTLDLLRQSARRQEHLNVYGEENGGSTESHPEAVYPSLTEAIESLPAIEKQIIHLFYLDELKISEISAVLEIPAGTVKSRLNRARNLLKDNYQQMENPDEH